MEPVVSGPQRTKFAWVAGLVAAVALGLFIAAGPAALRRPLLTPLGAGLLLGLLVPQLTAAEATRTRRWLPPFLCGVALFVWHAEQFRRIEQAAAVRIREQPAQLPALMLVEQASADDPGSEPGYRALRLSVRPTVRDYLSERSAVLLGERPWPLPAVWLVLETGLAMLVAACTSQRGVSR